MSQNIKVYLLVLVLSSIAISCSGNKEVQSAAQNQTAVSKTPHDEFVEAVNQLGPYLSKQDDSIDLYTFLENKRKEDHQGRALPSSLTQDEIMGIYLFTLDLYRNINNKLRSEQTKDIKAYLDVTVGGLKKLPSYIGTVYRREEFTSKAAASYLPGKMILNRAFTSTTADPNYSGKVIIHSISGRSIRDISLYEREDEVLFMPGTAFKVVNVTSYGAIELQEVLDGSDAEVVQYY